MKRLTSGIRAAGTLMLTVSGCAGVPQQTAPPDALIRMRLAHETQAPGTRQMEIAGSGEVYFIAEDDIVSDAHIQTTRAIETATGLSVNLWLTEEGVSRLSEATRSHIGGRLAILVGSKLVNAPVIRSEIGSSGATLGLTLPAAEARSVAAAIATRFESGD